MTCQDINVTVGKKELNLAIEKTIVNYSGTSNFLSLTDTPNNYTDSAGKLLRVKYTEDGIEFTDSPTVVDWNEIGGDQSDISLSGFTNDSGFISNLTTFTTDNLTEGTTNKYDKTVGLTAGDGIQVTGTYPNFTITNISEGNTDHSELDNLDYANSGHTGFQPTLTAGTNVDITNNVISATNTTYSSGDFNLSSLGDVDDTDKAEGKILQVDNLGKHVYVTNAGGSDEKVKYDSNDTTSGYLSEKIIAGTGISLSEGTGTDENKLVITNTGGGSTYTAGDGIDITENVISNTGVLTESDPVFNSWDKSTGISITESQISDFGNYLTSETDPVWTNEKGNYQATSEKGQNNGYASLDAGGKVPVSELPNSIIEYKGTWNASTNTPTLIDGTGNAGDVYIVSVAGTQNLGSGNISFLEGDWVMYNGTIWQKSINSNAVVSVNTQTGVVTLDADDISDTSTTNKFVTSTDITNLGNLSGTNSGDQESSDFNLAGLSDVDDTAKATGKILQVNSDGYHEYVDLPDPDVSGLVPYTGATNDVDLGNYDLTATDITSEGNIYIPNSKFIEGRNYADSAYVDTIKVNEDDNIEIGADLEVGDFILEATSEPATPEADSKVIYVTASGTTPNRQVVMKIKDEAGQEVILSSLIV